MTWFSLPQTGPENKAAFHDAASARSWLAEQPQANASFMLEALISQIGAYNLFATPPRERFKTLEVLRKTVFAVNGECRRRLENRALPLLPPEQSLFNACRHLWRHCAIAYLHCLRACLEHDPTLSPHGGRVAHRALSCLRMEQMNCYLAGVEVDGKFWRGLHAVRAAAERLHVILEPTEDRLLGETASSSVNGQYVMALLLHLACPFALSRTQLLATVRWFSRWREQVPVLNHAQNAPSCCGRMVDLTQDTPFHEGTLREARWLSLDPILRKMRKRRERLLAGETPEELKLGNTLGTDASIALLDELTRRLRQPAIPATPPPAQHMTAEVVVALPDMHRLFGGESLNAPGAQEIFGNRLHAEQIAVFDHAVQIEPMAPQGKPEIWQLKELQANAQHWLRHAAPGEERLMLGNVLAIRPSPQADYALATIRSLSMHEATPNSPLSIVCQPLPGQPVALVAELREGGSGRLSRHPALLIAQPHTDAAHALLLPAGVLNRALSVHFYDAQRERRIALQPGQLLERGGNYERWTCTGEFIAGGAPQP